jgi:cob(I)alamin adenosyltransferase
MPRLTRIYTRTGDDGSTGLGDGRRVPKTSARVAAIGDIDELNSVIGIVRAVAKAPDIDTMLQSIQHRLFDIGGELSMPGHSLATGHWSERLEQWLDRLNASLPVLQEFILPGGSLSAAHCHQARAVCRRAERSLLRLSQEETVNSATLKYLNRLSDLLFVIARVLARTDGGQEVTWQRNIE